LSNPLFQQNIGKTHKSPLYVLIAPFVTNKIWVDVTSFYLFI